MMGEHPQPVGPRAAIADRDAERVGRDVGQDHVGQVFAARLQPRLHRRAARDDFVRIMMLQRQTTEQPGGFAADDRHSCRPAGQHDMRQRFGADTAVGQGPRHRTAEPFQQRRDGAGESVGGQRGGRLLAFGQADRHLGERRTGQRFAGDASRRSDTGGEPLSHRPRHERVGRGDPGLGHEPVDHRRVEILAAEKVVAGGRAHFDDAVIHLEHRYVERSSAQIEDEDRPVGRTVRRQEAVGKRRRCRFVQHAIDAQTRQLAGTPRRAPLRIGKIGRHGDDRFVGPIAQRCLGIFQQ